MAVIVLYSRMILNRSLSNTIEAEWCEEVIVGAIEGYGKPMMLIKIKELNLPLTPFLKIFWVKILNGVWLAKAELGTMHSWNVFGVV